MKSTLVLALVCLAALVSGYAVPEKERKVLADKEFLSRQKQILRLFVRIQQPTLYQDLIEISRSYSIEENIDKYAFPKEVKKFLFLYKAGFFLPRSDIFVPLERKHSEQAKLLSELFYDAKDYDTFFKTAVWARNHLNGGVFLYSFTRSLQAREDTKFFYIPPYYEIYPFLFVDEHVIQNLSDIFVPLERKHSEQAKLLSELFYDAKDYDTFFKTAVWARNHLNGGVFLYSFTRSLQAREDTKFFYIPPYYEIYPFLFVDEHVIQNLYEARLTSVESGETKPIVLKSNYTGYWDSERTPENILAYFTEDVGLNAFNSEWNRLYPSWFNTTEYNVNIDRRGELFLYYQKQLLARYFLERLSNNLGDIPSFEEEYETGYFPRLRFNNGQSVTGRQQYSKFYDTEAISVQDVKETASRLRQAIESGYIFNEQGEKISLFETEGRNLLGELINFYGNSPNKHYYGSYFNEALYVTGHVADPQNQYGLAPSALLNYETALRDPLYYSLVQRMFDSVVYKYLAFPGIKVQGVEVDPLITYFDDFEINLDNVVSVNDPKDGEHVDFRVKQGRLNHKPFNYKVSVESDKEIDVLVKVFMSPKYDSYGREFDLDTKIFYTVELDRFPTKVNVGTTVIERNSRDSSVAVPDAPSFRYILNHVDAALEDKEEYFIDKFARYHGFPQRLLIPKGRKHGFPVEFVVVVLPYNQADKDDVWKYNLGSVTLLGTPANTKYPDSRPIDFPLDRPYRSVYDAFTPNTFVKTFARYHGFPQRLLIPKGRKHGFPVEFVVVVLPYNQADKDDVWKYNLGSVTLLGTPANTKYPDSRPIDFPLDRPYRSVYDAFTPNTFVKTVSIFHKNLDEINSVQA
uniref:Hexamerin-like protein 2 n=1 Tax=Timema genevievae TaxID=629358 RepID=A0A7R9JZ30_TIMGE|nr:unnamed protein product [Timema genevievae]